MDQVSKSNPPELQCTVCADVETIQRLLLDELSRSEKDFSSTPVPPDHQFSIHTGYIQ